VEKTKKKNAGKVSGGKARAKKLSPEERSEIAKRAAKTRWSQLPQAVCGSPDRPLKIANVELQCYVLEDGTRVISQSDFSKALGRHPKLNVKNTDENDSVPPILQGKSIKPFISEEVLQKSQPISFTTSKGKLSSGYRAELLPDICEIYLKARDDNALTSNQEHIVKQADILMRGLAHTGIIALVDEATGYQEFRAKDALSRILEAFIAKELQAWVQTFPSDYYKELFRLRGLQYPTENLKRPQYFGTLTNDIVYKRLAPGVLDELKRVTPKNSAGKLKHKLFQHLTSNVGYPKLREHLGSIVSIMKLSNGWIDFMNNLDRLHPRHGETMSLPMNYNASDDDGNGI
jgi:hypothetical protein